MIEIEIVEIEGAIYKPDIKVQYNWKVPATFCRESSINRKVTNRRWSVSVRSRTCVNTMGVMHHWMGVPALCEKVPWLCLLTDVLWSRPRMDVATY